MKVIRTALLVVALPLCGARSQAARPLTQQIDALIDAEYPRDEPGGVVLVGRGDSVIYRRAFGMANMEHSAPMRPDALFAIASITKQFTAVAVLQQVEKGTIALDDTVGKFLPTYPAALRRVTIRQLLTHTGGVPAAKSVASLLAMGRAWFSADQIMATFKDQPLDFEPGSKMLYSNSGYQLLGYILEKVTGEPYSDLIETTLLKRAGMTRSFYGNDMKIVPNRASPYVYVRDRVENAMNGNSMVAFAAGAIQSTADDFFKWHRALLAGTFISKATLESAWTPARIADDSEIEYGFGWFVGELQGSRLVEHGGNMGGFMTHTIYLPREDLLVVVFLNSRGKRLPELVATDVAAMAMGRPINLKPAALSDSVMRSYSGAYKNPEGVDAVIGLEGGKLFYQRSGGTRIPLTALGNDKLYFENTSIVGTVQRDARGAITGVELQQLRRTQKSLVKRVAAP